MKLRATVVFIEFAWWECLFGALLKVGFFEATVTCERKRSLDIFLLVYSKCDENEIRRERERNSMFEYVVENVCISFYL